MPGGSANGHQVGGRLASWSTHSSRPLVAQTPGTRAQETTVSRMSRAVMNIGLRMRSLRASTQRLWPPDFFFLPDGGSLPARTASPSTAAGLLTPGEYMSLITDPWVEDGVQQVDEQRGDQED